MIRRPPRSTLFPSRRSSDLPDAKTVNGKTIGENCTGKFTEDREVIRAFDQPMLDDAGFLNLKGNLLDRKSTRLNSSHGYISYAVFCLKKKSQYLTSYVLI